MKLETEKPQYDGNNSEQYGNSESSLVEAISGTELNYTQPNTVTDTSTKLKLKIMAKPKVATQPRV